MSAVREKMMRQSSITDRNRILESIGLLDEQISRHLHLQVRLLAKSKDDYEEAEVDRILDAWNRITPLFDQLWAEVGKGFEPGCRERVLWSEDWRDHWRDIVGKKTGVSS